MMRKHVDVHRWKKMTIKSLKSFEISLVMKKQAMVRHTSVWLRIAHKKDPKHHKKCVHWYIMSYDAVI